MGILKEYAGKKPVVGERVYLAETAAVIGDVVLGDDVSIWYNSVVRGDCHYIRIGARSNIQDNCAIHVTQGTHPTILEEEVTLGHGAIVHGATVRRGALIGIRATVMDGAVVGESAFVGAGAPRHPADDRAAPDSLARVPGAAGARALRRRGRRPPPLPPELPRVQRGVLPGGRRVGAMKARLKAPKGTHDLLPGDSERFAAVEAEARRVFGSYGYGEIRTPVFESTELFARSVGETTDIVHKEMYTFPDRKGRSLTLRPENTAGVVRALVEKGIQEMPRPIRLWYAGPQFRYEQPQAGRYREFRQIGVELLGVPGPAGDAEVLGMLFEFLRALGFHDALATINCIPKGAARERFSAALQEHVRPHAGRLGADDRKRLDENPLRLFDSKDPETRGVLAGAPATLDFLDEASRVHHEELKELLAKGGVRFAESAGIVRGIDYYTLTVFEVASERLGAQNALLGGGRYDDLVAELGGPPTPAVGFASGEDRLVEAMTADVRPARTLIWVIPDGPAEFVYALGVAGEFRALMPGAVVESDLSGRGIAKGLGRAGQIEKDPSKYPFRVGAVRAVLLGSQEREGDTVTMKDLSTGAQETFPRRQLAERLAGRER